MGITIGPAVEFKCSSDCRQMGCPGHTIRQTFCRSSDMYGFEVDGKSKFIFDENQFAALLKAHELAKGV